MIFVRYQNSINVCFLIAVLGLLTACATTNYNWEQNAINKQLKRFNNYVSDSDLDLNEAERDYLAKQLKDIRNLALMSLDPSVSKLINKDLKRIKNELKKTKRNSHAKGTNDSNRYLKSNDEWFEEILSKLK